MKKFFGLFLSFTVIIGVTLSGCDSSDSSWDYSSGSSWSANTAESATTENETTEVETETAVTEDETAVMYRLYYDKLMELEDEYGEPYISDYLDCLDGLCFAKLLDFDNDGTEELVLAYGIEQNREDGYQYSTYYIEVWEFDNGTINRVFEGSGYGYDGDTTTLYITCVDNCYYMIEGSSDAFEYSYFYGYSGDDFSLIQSLEEDDFGEPTSFTIDGVQVTKSEWDDAHDKWWDGVVAYLLWYPDSAGNEYNEDAINPQTELENTLEVLTEYLGIESED